MASSKDVPPDAKMLALLQQYREAQEERLRIEGTRGLSQMPKLPVQSTDVEENEQVTQNAHGKYVRYDVRTRLAPSLLAWMSKGIDVT